MKLNESESSSGKNESCVNRNICAKNRLQARFLPVDSESANCNTILTIC